MKRLLLILCLLVFAASCVGVAEAKNPHDQSPGDTKGNPHNQTTANQTQAATQAAPDDRCSNIEGDQAQVPKGYQEASGYCSPSSGDWCPNFEDRQNSVPAGYTVDDKGNCVGSQQTDPQPAPQTQTQPPTAPTPDPQPAPDPTPTPTPTPTPDPTPTPTPDPAPTPTPAPDPSLDMCDNIAGVQPAVPEGMHATESSGRSVCSKQAKCTGKQTLQANGSCKASTVDLNFVSPSMPLVKPVANKSGDDNLGEVQLDETKAKPLANGPTPKVKNPLFPWISAPLLAMLIILPPLLAGLFFYLAVHRPRRQAIAAVAPTPAADPAVAIPDAVTALPIADEIDESDLIPPRLDEPGPDVTQPLPPV